MDQNKKKINKRPKIKIKFQKIIKSIEIQNWIKMNKNPKIDQNS